MAKEIANNVYCENWNKKLNNVLLCLGDKITKIWDELLNMLMNDLEKIKPHPRIIDLAHIIICRNVSVRKFYR